MADNTWRLWVDTQELSPDEVAQIAKVKGELINFLIVPGDAPQQAPPKPKPEKGEQSPSQQLREAIYQRFLAEDTIEHFEVFYRAEIQHIIDNL